MSMPYLINESPPRLSCFRALINVLCVAITAIPCAMCAEDRAATDFLDDEQFRSISNVVTTMHGEYVLEYKRPDKLSEIERRTTIIEWMTRDKYRVEVTGEEWANGKADIEQKEVWTIDGGKIYCYNALVKVLTKCNEDEQPTLSFSNPLSYKSMLASDVLRDKGIRARLGNVCAHDFPTTTGKMLSISQHGADVYEMSESNNPTNHTAYVMHFAPGKRVIPQVVDCWGDRITLGADGNFIRTRKILAVFRISERGTVNAGGILLEYPMQIDWQEATGTTTLCVIKVMKLTVNEKFSDKIFTPDLSAAERIEDTTKKRPLDF